MSKAGAGRGVVAASHPDAAAAGAELLAQGGNAVDAAAAVQFALNVVEPLASGLGGGAFILVHARGQTTVLDCRERAPAAAHANDLVSLPGRPLDWPDRAPSGLSVGVPGTLLGFSEALRRWGRRSLAETLRPAIALAESGTTVGPFFGRRLGQHAPLLRRDPAAATVFLPGGQPLRQGDRLVQPELARTLRLLAEAGPAAFYDGPIGQALVRAVQARGGRMTPADLASFRVAERPPLRAAYGGYQLLTMPPPGAGVALLQALRLLEPFEVGRLDPLGVERAHLELQALRLALLDREAYLADPDLAPVPLAGLLDEGYLAERRRLIERERLGPAPRAGRPPGGPASAASSRETGQTTHFVVVDREGDLVCCTSTIESFFGSGIMVPELGLLLNNELTDFASQPGGPNELRPGGRPPSSMVPTLLLKDGVPVLALGSPGGQTIVSAVVQVLLRLLADGMELQAAIDAPRWFPGSYPRLTWEPGLPARTLAGLSALGHGPAGRPTSIGSVQAAQFERRSGQWVGAADQRREGNVRYVD